MVRKYIDFDIIKETWNKYELQDGTKLKIRSELHLAWTEQVKGKTVYRVTTNHQQTCLCDPKTQGKPDNTLHPPEQLQKHIDVQKCPHTTMQYEPSEYLLDDGTQIIIHDNLINVARTSLYDARGDRIYLIESNSQMSVKIPQK